MVQWVERPTEKPAAVLARVRVPGAARDFSPTVNSIFLLESTRFFSWSQLDFSPRVNSIFLLESTSGADSLTVSVQPRCAVACINICSCVRNPKHWQQYYHCLETRKYSIH